MKKTYKILFLLFLIGCSLSALFYNQVRRNSFTWQTYPLISSVENQQTNSLKLATDDHCPVITKGETIEFELKNDTGQRLHQTAPYVQIEKFLDGTWYCRPKQACTEETKEQVPSPKSDGTTAVKWSASLVAPNGEIPGKEHLKELSHWGGPILEPGETQLLYSLKLSDYERPGTYRLVFFYLETIGTAEFRVV